MSEPSPDDDPVFVRLNQLLGVDQEYFKRRDAGELTGVEWDEVRKATDEIETELKSLGLELPELRTTPIPKHFTQAQGQLLEFFERMRARQGTIMPDFDALYRRKMELDQKSCDASHSETGP
jgi:hypothetical protein